LKKLEKLAAENDDAHARHEAGTLAEELAEQTEPVLPRVYVDDATGIKDRQRFVTREEIARVLEACPDHH